MTLTEAIRDAAEKLTVAGVTTPRTDAEVLLAHSMHKDRVWVITHINDHLENGKKNVFEEAIRRRAGREPLQYIVGTQEFWGLDFKVTPDVLIPRPETELVVESAISVLKGSRQPTIIDVCTGSGCIAVSLAREIEAPRIFAIDRSTGALRIARENALRHGVAESICILEGDLFLPLDKRDIRGRVDLITANPPYISLKDLSALQPEVKDYEPETALIAGPKGTEVHHRIIAQAPEFLKKDGALIMEMGIGQAEALQTTADAARAFKKPVILRDLAGIDRVMLLHKK